MKNNAAIAVLKKSTREDSMPGGTLACVLPWGHGWGWSTLPNGVWSGGMLKMFYIICLHLSIYISTVLCEGVLCFYHLIKNKVL